MILESADPSQLQEVPQQPKQGGEGEAAAPEAEPGGGAEASDAGAWAPAVTQRLDGQRGGVVAEAVGEGGDAGESQHHESPRHESPRHESPRHESPLVQAAQPQGDLEAPHKHQGELVAGGSAELVAGEGEGEAAAAVQGWLVSDRAADMP